MIDFFITHKNSQVHEMAMVSAIQEAQKDNLRSFNDYMMKVLEVSLTHWIHGIFLWLVFTLLKKIWFVSFYFASLYFLCVCVYIVLGPAFSFSYCILIWWVTAVGFFQICCFGKDDIMEIILAGLSSNGVFIMDN